MLKILRKSFKDHKFQETKLQKEHRWKKRIRLARILLQQRYLETQSYRYSQFAGDLEDRELSCQSYLRVTYFAKRPSANLDQLEYRISIFHGLSEMSSF